MSTMQVDEFADIAARLGVPRSVILLETTSGNTGENIRFSYERMQANRIPMGSIIVVQKP